MTTHGEPEMPENVPDLYRLAFIPGVFRCPKCGFELARTTLNIAQGVAGTTEADRQSEPCPNDGIMMVHVTYRERVQQFEDRLVQEFERYARLTAENRELKAQLERMGKPVSDEEWDAERDHYEPGEVITSHQYSLCRGGFNRIIAARASKEAHP